MWTTLVATEASAVATDPTTMLLSQLGLGTGLAGLCVLAVKVLFSAQSKTLDLERQLTKELREELRKLHESRDQRVEELTEALRKRNESIEERVIPALLQSADAVRDILRVTRREHDRD